MPVTLHAHHRPPAPRSPALLAAVGLILSVAVLPAMAQTAGELRFGVAAGSADYGTAVKAQVGQGFALPFLPGAWRWEGQLTSFGRETYQQFGNSYERSAWAVGASVLPQLAITQGFTAFGKLGVHHLHSQASGPGLSTSQTDFKIGYGAGLRWQALPRLGLRLEAENIGGSGGDLVTLGAEIPW